MPITLRYRGWLSEVVKPLEEFIESFSIRSRKMAPVRITCRDWDDGVIFDWYREEEYTTISKLELRKERDNYKHEYIVIYLDNGWVHRIDRRPIRGANFEPISKEGCEAEDCLTPVSDADLNVIRSETDAEITLEFGSNKPDLYSVIAVAVAIHLDPRTKNYTLQQYNCYFVARSIITLVTRHCLLQSSPTNGLRWDRVTEPMILAHVFDGNWDKLGTLLKAAMISVLRKVVWDVVAKDAGTRIEKRKDWVRLRYIVNEVIRNEVERCDIVLAGSGIPNAVTEWIIEATQVTLWHGNLEQSVSELQFPQLSDQRAPHVKTPPLFLRIKKRRDEPLLGLPRATLERLLTSLLERLPVALIRNIPEDVIANIPEDLTDLLRQAIKSNVFGGEELKQELREQVQVILRRTLIASSGELPTSLIRAFIRVDAKQVMRAFLVSITKLICY